jgi:hypothetical protein
VIWLHGTGNRFNGFVQARSRLNGFGFRTTHATGLKPGANAIKLWHVRLSSKIPFDAPQVLYHPIWIRQYVVDEN